MKSGIKGALFSVLSLFAVLTNQQVPDATANQTCVTALNQLYSQCGMEINLVDTCKNDGDSVINSTVCAANCVSGMFNPLMGCSQCSTGYGFIPSCCDEVCAENCVVDAYDALTGCSNCTSRFKPPACCECEDGYVRQGSLCVDACPANCGNTSLYDPVTGCRECLDGFMPPGCCLCASGLVMEGAQCILPICDENCQGGIIDPLTGGCNQCLSGYGFPPSCCDVLCFQYCQLGSVELTGCTDCLSGLASPTCCDCEDGLIRVDSDFCARACPENCRNSSQLDQQTGCGECLDGFVAPICSPGLVMEGNQCILAVCTENCDGPANLSGCSRCNAGFRPPSCCCDWRSIGEGRQCTTDFFSEFPSASLPLSFEPPITIQEQSFDSLVGITSRTLTFGSVALPGRRAELEVPRVFATRVRISTDTADLDRISELVDQNHHPQVAIIFSGYFFTGTLYQAIVSTDGRESYATLLYGESFERGFSLDLHQDSSQPITVFQDFFHERYVHRIDSGRAVLFPFGMGNGDTQAPSAFVGTFGPTTIDIPIIVFQSEETTFYVASNGLISFRNSYFSSEPRTFDRSFTDFRNPLIAPLWNDFNRILVSIYYRSTVNTTVLNRIAEMITGANSNYSDYEPRNAAIVTWDSGIDFVDGLSLGSKFTFQAVLSTDGRRSFAVFIYAGDRIALIARPRQIGFNAGDGSRWSNIEIRSLESVNIFRIDGVCITRVIPGDVCPLNSYSALCDEQEMKAIRCFCDFEVQSSLCSRLFPFGNRSSDNFIDRGIVEVEGPITLPVPFHFYRTMEERLYISTNGLISFRESFSDFRLSRLPRLSIGALPIIAPLWGDYNFRQGGNVVYRVTTDNRTLERATELIVENNPSFSEFSSSLCVIVTWVDAVLLSRVFDATQFSFQAVLCTDGEVSFALFIYVNLAFIRNIVTDERGIIGFDAGDQNRGDTVLYGEEDNFLKEVNVFRVDGNCVTATQHCELNSSALECAADFSAESCICDSTSTDSRCRLINFFPFGSGSDNQGPREIDGSVRIDITKKVVYYNKEHLHLYVSTNGFISFEESFSNEVELFGNLPFPMIAPLWADFNFREGGTLYYRVANDNNTLNAIVDRISQEAPIYRNYTPTEAVIVTWFQSSVFESQNNSMTNFQAVVVTDESISFALFIYDDGVQSFVGPHRMGFDAGDRRRSLELDSRLLFQELIFRIDGEVIVEYREDSCGLNSVPLHPAEGPTTIVCQCSGTAMPDDGSCLVFLQFGARGGDVTSFSPPSVYLELPTPVIFYGEPESNVQILGNGISFNNISSSSRDEMSLTSSLYPALLLVPSTAAILSVFERPRDTVIGERILHHRIVTSDNGSTLSQINSIIYKFNEDLKDFEATCALVTTWEMTLDFVSVLEFVNGSRAFLFESTAIDTLVQIVLATNGVTSFAIMLYEDPNDWIQFSDLIGFSPGGRNTTRPSSLTEIMELQVFRIDGECITSAMSGSVCGLNSVASQCNSLSAVICSCNEGYETSDGFNCTDIDECENETICDQICINTTGSYFCNCFKGYHLTIDMRTCEDTDECRVNETICEQECININGSFICDCIEGYSLSNDSITCNDINECEDVSICEQVCVNIDGSYFCRCNEGYDLNRDNMTCDKVQMLTAGASNSLEISLSVVFGVIALAVLLLVILVVVYLLYRRKTLHSRKVELTGTGDLEENESQRLRHFTVQSSFKLDVPKSLIIPSCNLKLGATLGQGFVQEESVRDLLKECGRMYKFDHPNVLKLSGVCLDGGPAPYIIMPFMANGSLSAYLKKERENFLLDEDSVTPDDVMAVEKTLMNMCIQVAKGMEYLSSKRVIHRDLAARNCMMDMNLVIKVADFGLAQSLDTSKDYFRQDQHNAIKLPIKWLAPESINDGVFSEKSDVWSYGVTCWEIFSGGKTPYPGIHPADLPQQLDKGLRLEKPVNAACSDDIYSLMAKCWDSDAHLRPPFAELVEQLSELLEVMAEYLEFSVEPVADTQL